MKIRAAVVDSLPLYRRGVVASLNEIGHAVDTPDDVWPWLAGTETPVVVLGLSRPADWQLLAALHASCPDLLVLAIIDGADTLAYVRAVRAGALGVIPRTSSPATLQQSFTDLINGRALLPVEALRSLVSTAGPAGSDERHTPSEEELAWLRQLAAGSTVSELQSLKGQGRCGVLA